jgi:hypothetical protein
MIPAGERPVPGAQQLLGQAHGLLTLARHLRAGPEYVEIGPSGAGGGRAAFRRHGGEDRPGGAGGWTAGSAPELACSAGGPRPARWRGLPAAAAGGGRAGAERSGGSWKPMCAHPELGGARGRGPAPSSMRAAGVRARSRRGPRGVYCGPAAVGRAVGVRPQGRGDGGPRAPRRRLTAAMPGAAVGPGTPSPGRPAAFRTVDPAQNWRGGSPPGRLSTRTLRRRVEVSARRSERGVGPRPGVIVDLRAAPGRGVPTGDAPEARAAQ